MQSIPLRDQLNTQQFKINQPLKKLIIYCCLLFLVKILCLPFVHYVDSDGVTRIYHAINWMNDPVWITSGNWGPFYFYLMGTALKIFYSQIYTPLVVNILFSVATLFPLFFLLKRLFNEDTALILSFLFSLTPIIFRLSLLSLAETPFLFFVVLSFSILLKGVTEKKLFYIFLGGTMASIAGGFRYEIWILSALISLIMFFKTTKLFFITYSVTSFIFPITWLFLNYFDSGNSLNSFNWAFVAANTNKVASFESLLRRIWFFPLSLIFAFGPIGFFYTIKSLFANNTVTTHKEYIKYFVIVFIIILSIFLFNSIRGSLLMQHRFTITLYLISFPLMGYYFISLNKKKIYMMFIFAFSSLALSYVYSSKGTQPIPQLSSKQGTEINNYIMSSIGSDNGLIVDFWNWENTYCIAFMSDIPRKQIALQEYEKELNVFFEEVNNCISVKPKGYFLLCNKSRLYNNVTISADTSCIKMGNINLPVKIIKRLPEITLFKYNYKTSE